MCSETVPLSPFYVFTNCTPFKICHTYWLNNPLLKLLFQPQIQLRSDGGPSRRSKSAQRCAREQASDDNRYLPVTSPLQPGQGGDIQPSLIKVRDTALSKLSPLTATILVIAAGRKAWGWVNALRRLPGHRPLNSFYVSTKFTFPDRSAPDSCHRRLSEDCAKTDC